MECRTDDQYLIACGGWVIATSCIKRAPFSIRGCKLKPVDFFNNYRIVFISSVEELNG